MIANVLAILKTLLGIDGNSRDALLVIYVEEVVSRVEAYLDITTDKLAELPLEKIMAFMAKDLYNGNSGEAVSLSESDRSVSFAVQTSQIISNYETTLRKYRKMRW